MLRLITFAWGPYTWLIKPCVEALARQWVGPFPNGRMTVMTDDPKAASAVDADLFQLHQGWRTDNFSNRLKDLLMDVSEPIIFWTTPDTFWLDRINGHDIQALADYMMCRHDIVRITLYDVPSLEDHHVHAAVVGGMELVGCSDPEHCSLVSGLAMGAGLLNRKWLLELLEPGWNIWDVENRGTSKMHKHYPWLTSLAVYPGLRKVDVCHRGQVRDLSPLPDWMKDMIQEARLGHQ